MEKVRKLSFVIPCYGSEKTIKNVIDDIVKTISKNDDYEIICINDHSKDGVLRVLKEIAVSNKKVKIINLSKNFGQHNALMCGFRHISGDIIIALDDDGQTDPTQCYKLINEINDNVDVVFARYVTIKQNYFRIFGSYINKKMSQWLLGMPKDIIYNSYFVCKRFVIDEIIKYNNPYTYLSGLVFRTTMSVKNVDIEHKNRLYGKSGYSILKLYSLWVNGFTAFSVKPLRISSLIGMFLSIISFLFGIYQIILKILNPMRQLGYSSLMCVILFTGGIIMVMLGLIGEYIGRIYISINNSPQYVIKEKINFEN